VHQRLTPKARPGSPPHTGSSCFRMI
jgi:hypothetical protein